jgi:sigma-E factor negative regulatory protein RseB
VLGPDGRVLESSAFTELKMDVVGGQASVLTPLRNLGGWREVHLASQETRLEQEGWTLGPLPAGFSLLGAVRKAIALPADPAVRQAPASTVHAVFSDGLPGCRSLSSPRQGRVAPPS